MGVAGKGKPVDTWVVATLSSGEGLARRIIGNRWEENSRGQEGPV